MSRHCIFGPARFHGVGPGGGNRDREAGPRTLPVVAWVASCLRLDGPPTERCEGAWIEHAVTRITPLRPDLRHVDVIPTKVWGRRNRTRSVQMIYSNFGQTFLPERHTPLHPRHEPRESVSTRRRPLQRGHGWADFARHELPKTPAERQSPRGSRVQTPATSRIGLDQPTHPNWGSSNDGNVG